MGTKAPRVVVALLAVLIGELSATALRGSQEPTYKAGIRTVAVYATVTGPDGRLMTDLTQDAFAIDRARIGSFSNRIQLDLRDFTSDHGDLITILKTELQPEGPTPLWNAIYVGVTALLHQQGRRVILVFTDGMDNPEGGTTNSLKTVMKYAEEETS